LEKGILLRVTEPSIIIQLEKSRAKRYLLEQLTSTIVLIKPGGENVVQQVLTELGYLADFSPIFIINHLNDKYKETMMKSLIGFNQK